MKFSDMSPIGRVTIGCESPPFNSRPARLLPVRDDKFLTEDGPPYLHLDEVRTRGQMIQDKRFGKQVVRL